MGKKGVNLTTKMPGKLIKYSNPYKSRGLKALKKDLSDATPEVKTTMSTALGKMSKANKDLLKETEQLQKLLLQKLKKNLDFRK